MKRSLIGFSFAAALLSPLAYAQQMSPSQPAQQSPAAQPTMLGRDGSTKVTVRDPEGERRVATIEWNPLSLITISKVSFNAIITPVDHHAFVFSPHYAWADTARIWVFNRNGDQTQLPEQKFKDVGAELGYRYYTGKGGPRGLFVGPSLLLDAVWAKPQVGPTKSFADIGAALDVGYQVLLADRVSLSLGGGIQYLFSTSSIPDQQFPAHIIANREFNPRVLLSLGWAF